MKPSLPHHGPSLVGTMVPIVPTSQSMVIVESVLTAGLLKPISGSTAFFGNRKASSIRLDALNRNGFCHTRKQIRDHTLGR